MTRAPARSASPTPSPARLLDAVVRWNILVMPPVQRITAVHLILTGAEVGDVEPDRAGDLAVAKHDVGHADIAQPADARIAARLVAQRRADCRTRAQKIDIDAALAAVTRRLDLVDLAVVAPRPIDLPAGELANPLRDCPRKAARRDSRCKGPRPALSVSSRCSCGAVGLRLAERGRARHLRHDGRAAAPDHVLVEQQDAGAVACRGDRREHAGAAAADHQDIALNGDFVGHSWCLSRPLFVLGLGQAARLALRAPGECGAA